MLLSLSLSQLHKSLALQTDIASGNIGAHNITPRYRQKQMRGVFCIVVNRNRVGRLTAKMFVTHLVEIFWLIISTADFKDYTMASLE